MKIELGLDRIRSVDFWRATFAELFATMLFVFLITTIVTKSPAGFPSTDMKIGLGVGLGLSSLVQAVGHVSGAHLNPAVTVGMTIVGKISVIQGFLYILVQVIGGIVGAALTYGMTTNSANRGTLAVPALGEGVTVAQGFGVELIFTFLLVFVIFSVTDEKKMIDPYGVALAIGVVLTMCHIAAIPLTGCSVNPARAFGPAVVMNNFKNHWLYWIAPLLGGVLAGLMYEYIFYVKKPIDGDAERLLEEE